MNAHWLPRGLAWRLMAYQQQGEGFSDGQPRVFVGLFTVPGVPLGGGGGGGGARAAAQAAVAAALAAAAAGAPGANAAAGLPNGGWECVAVPRSHAIGLPVATYLHPPGPLEGGGAGGGGGGGGGGGVHRGSAWGEGATAPPLPYPHAQAPSGGGGGGGGSGGGGGGAAYSETRAVRGPAAFGYPKTL